ncbi:VOC family protein [Actinoplanes sp. LDG1-06]|uniref:VOC family protein n=1 Tax=Paractinoplanes ovalisporus TaxID=2810368 RepID=A0ABS2A3S8_9ACTN|nr:VOC family protein [Actinoplanes ovalisporus]MBM2614500.1 VOC family protein [Actinoplanes ovalisporus]
MTGFGGRPGVELVVVVDCSDLDRSAAFWCGVLGYRADPSSSGRYRQLMPETGPGLELLLQRVPELKTTKNRLHLDLRVPDLAAETSRVSAFGARRVTAEPIEEDGWTWHVFADPDGNEFCVLQPPRAPSPEDGQTN